MIGLASLFLVAFLAATPLPLQSEILFVGMQAAGWATGMLVVVASVGNTLGSCVTYALGRWPAQRTKAEAWQARWGIWALLLCWLPGGDLIVALSGVLRVPFPQFLMLVGLAKTARYVALGWLGAAAFGG